MSRRWPATMGARDSNESEIVTALQRVGAIVEPLPSGKGVPDLLVGYDGTNYLMEVKPLPVKGKVFASHVSLNYKQKDWHEAWRGQVDVVRTPEEALKVIGVKAK